jgi:hypothetical protein
MRVGCDLRLEHDPEQRLPLLSDKDVFGIPHRGWCHRCHGYRDRSGYFERAAGFDRDDTPEIKFSKKNILSCWTAPWTSPLAIGDGMRPPVHPLP